MIENISSKSYQQRFIFGDGKAEIIMQCLRDNGADIPELTENQRFEDDTQHGIDTWVKALPDKKFKKPKSAQVKYRGNGPTITVMPRWFWTTDIQDEERANAESVTVECTGKLLFCTLEPYYGWNDNRNGIGRDAKHPIPDLVIMGCKGRVYVMDGPKIKDEVNACMEEFRQAGAIFGRERVFVCKSGSFLRLKKDDSNGRMKILVFIDPDLFPTTKTYSCSCLE